MFLSLPGLGLLPKHFEFTSKSAQEIQPKYSEIRIRLAVLFRWKIRNGFHDFIFLTFPVLTFFILYEKRLNLSLPGNFTYFLGSEILTHELSCDWLKDD